MRETNKIAESINRSGLSNADHRETETNGDYTYTLRIIDPFGGLGRAEKNLIKVIVTYGNKQVAEATYGVSDDGESLYAWNIDVDRLHRRKGIASQIYRMVKKFGDIIPSTEQTPDARKLWTALIDRGITKEAKNIRQKTITEVEQFSNWNAQLRKLLNEADSVHDRPDEDHELEHVGVDNDNDDENTDAISDFLAKAGKIDKDLYSISLYDYGNEFRFENANSVIEDILSEIDNPVVQEFADKLGSLDSNNKTVCALIYNERTNEFFIYRAGANINEFTPEIPELVANGVIEPNQISVLRKIQGLGKVYRNLVNQTEWKPGNVPDDERVIDALETLLNELALPSMPDVPQPTPDHLLSDEQKQRNKETNDWMDATRAERIHALLAKKKLQGVGREKR